VPAPSASWPACPANYPGSRGDWPFITEGETFTFDYCTDALDITIHAARHLASAGWDMATHTWHVGHTSVSAAVKAVKAAAAGLQAHITAVAAPQPHTPQLVVSYPKQPQQQQVSGEQPLHATLQLSFPIHDDDAAASGSGYTTAQRVQAKAIAEAALANMVADIKAVWELEPAPLAAATAAAAPTNTVGLSDRTCKSIDGGVQH
jgi:hypothetical protein